jgi:DNA invertase Pin-like site-specific DNA recombinase
MIKNLPCKPRRLKAKKSGASDVYGASYSRCTVQSEMSIAEQQREIALKANRDCVIIPHANQFVDNGDSGTARHRGGLDALLVAARLARFRVLYLRDLTRLSRDLTMLLPIIDELAFQHGIRVVSIQDDFDTGAPGWGRHAALMRQRHD